MIETKTNPQQPGNLSSKHPSGLAILFFTEMWERFSYYGMRALLVLYLVNSLEFTRANALEIYATYTMLVYFAPVVGGYLADRYLGQRRSILIGAIVMALGHFAMAFPSLLYTGLGLLIVGNGFFKPNISTMVGALYEENDSRRDGGFTIFYMGINLGAFLAPLVCGTLGEKFGWHYGFAAASVGMCFAIVIFLYGQRRLNFKVRDAVDGQSRRVIANKGNHFTKQDWTVILLVSIAAIVFVGFFVQIWSTVSSWRNEISVTVGVALSLILVILFRNASMTRTEIHRIISIFIIAVFVIFFWMGFEQAGGTMNLFADKLTDRHVLGWQVPASYFQSINPLVIILMAPLVSVVWIKLDNSRFALSSVSKQAIGMIILGLGFVVLAIAQQRADQFGQVSPLWLVTVYVLHTMGELCLSPVGLSMVTKLAPAQFVSLMMGMWFAAMAIASYLAGTLESIMINLNIPLYWFLVGSSIGAGLLLLIISPLIHRLMHGIR